MKDRELELGKKAAMGVVVDKMQNERAEFTPENGFFFDFDFNELCQNEDKYVRCVPWEVGHLYGWEPDQFQLEDARRDEEIKEMFWSSPLLKNTYLIEQDGITSGDGEIRRIAYANPVFEPSEELKEELFERGEFEMLLSRKDFEPSFEQIEKMFDRLETNEIYTLLENNSWSPRGEVLEKCLNHSDNDVRYLTWYRQDWKPTLEQSKLGIQDASGEIREMAWNHPNLKADDQCFEIGRNENNPKIQEVVAVLQSAYEKEKLDARFDDLINEIEDKKPQTKADVINKRYGMAL